MHQLINKAGLGLMAGLTLAASSLVPAQASEHDQVKVPVSYKWLDQPAGTEAFTGDLDLACATGLLCGSLVESETLYDGLGHPIAEVESRNGEHDRAMNRLEAVVTQHRLMNIVDPIPAASAPHSFVDMDDPVLAFGQEALSAAVENGIVTGRTATDFAPRESISRAAFVAMLHRTVDLIEPSADAPTFPDMDAADVAWATDHVRWAAEAGITVGNNGMFEPREDLTRLEAVLFLLRFDDYLDSLPPA